VTREATLQRYLEIWNGTRDLGELDELVTPTYVGHIGSRDRDLQQLKQDITVYRQQAGDVRFEVMHPLQRGRSRRHTRGRPHHRSVHRLRDLDLRPEHQPMGRRPARRGVGSVGAASIRGLILKSCISCPSRRDLATDRHRKIPRRAGHPLSAFSRWPVLSLPGKSGHAESAAAGRSDGTSCSRARRRRVRGRLQ
jgi:hypothetical protein